MRPALIAVLALLPVSALACDGETLMSCTTKNGAKLVEACLTDDAITYSYRSPGRVPDLFLVEPLYAGTYEPWLGIGRSISEALIFRNDGYSYRVWTSVDKFGEPPQMQGGVTVEQGDKVVAFLACDLGSVIGLIDNTYDAMTQRGYCWNMQDFAWSVSCP